MSDLGSRQVGGSDLGSTQSAGAAAVVASVTASATSGTAPFAVHLDMSASTCSDLSDPARELDFYVDWDDADSMLPTSIGCCAGHLFESAGSYTVSVIITNPETGESDTDSVSVTISDPDTDFATTDTVCLSPSGTFTGAPTGASEQTVTDGDDINTYLAAGKRVLLNRGETFTCSASINVPDGAILGAYGTGSGADVRGIHDNNPIVDFNGTASAIIIANGAVNEVKVHDLIVQDSEYAGSAIQVAGNGNVENCVIARNWVKRADASHIGASADTAMVNDVVPNPNLCVAYNRVTPKDLADGGSEYGVFLGANKLMALGNYIEGNIGSGAGYTSHVSRWVFVHKAVVQGNTFEPTDEYTRHVLKFHHAIYATAAATSNVEPIAQDWCITQNTYSGVSETWPVAIAPADTITDIRMDGGFVSQETFDGYGYAAAYRIAARNVLCSNIRATNTDAGGWTRLFEVGKRGIEPSTQDFRAYHCSFYVQDTQVSGDYSIAYIMSGAGEYDGTDALVHNCVVDTDGTEEASVYSASGLSHTNTSNVISTATPGFVNAASGNLRLASGSALIDAGTQGPVRRDVRGFVRDASPDIGAYESEAGAEQVTELTATKDGADVDLAWLDLGVVDNYIVQRSPNGVDTWTQIATPTSPSATDTNPGTGTWYYRIAAVVDATTGDWSDTASVTFSAPGDRVGNFGFWW